MLEGLARIEREAAAGALADAAAAVRAHKRHCVRCVPMDYRRPAYCDQGWDLAKAEAAARDKLRQLDSPPGEQAPRLF